MYNNTGSKTYDNCWDFVAEGEHGLYMDIDSEIVGKNFLYMLTRGRPTPAWLKEAFDALSADEQAYFQPTIDAMESEAADLGLGADGAYALAWIKLWVESYNAQTDDGPICNTLVDKSATDQFGLLVYSKLRSVEESASVSVNNINVAAYQRRLSGHRRLRLLPLSVRHRQQPPALDRLRLHRLHDLHRGRLLRLGQGHGRLLLQPQGGRGDRGHLSPPDRRHDRGRRQRHSTAKNDRGYDWWTTDGKLVLEDPEYCASVAFTVGSWIEMLTKYSAG